MYDDLLSASNLCHRDLSFNSLSGPIPRSYEGPSSCLTSMLTNVHSDCRAIHPRIQIRKLSMSLLQHSLCRSNLTGFHSYRIKSCLRGNLPCSGETESFILLMNCGGGKVIMDGNEYVDDRYIRTGCIRISCF
ncbi:unnamed protein product [Musa textilis]